MTDHPNLRIVRNLRDLNPEDRGMIEGEVGYIDLRAMPSARATHASHRARSGLGHTVGVAIAIIASDRFLFGFACFSFGCLFTVSAAYVWSFFL